MKPLARGFTLIEMLIALAVVGILTTIALPSYTAYLTRTRLTEAFTTLAAIQPTAEQYWSNNRTFDGLPAPAATTNFSYAVSGASASAYTLTATGRNAAASFVYTINESGTRVTTGVPTGWTTSANCWVDRKGGLCTQ